MKKIDFNKIYNKNCLEGMKLIDKNKIDLIITDPPFAIDFKAKKANYNRKSSRVIEGYNEILPENYSQFSYDWISEANRILKESGSMYIFSGWNNLFVCKNTKKRKFYPFSRYGKNEKSEDGHSLHYQDKEDVWEIKREYWTGEDKTPTKLPAEIIKKILMYSSKKNDIVFDPFLGSGQVAVVGKMLDRRFCGFEIVKEYYNFAQKRLRKNVYRLNEKSNS